MPKQRGSKHPQKALSDAFVRTVTKPGLYADGNGLNLRVDKSGSRRWVQRLVIQGRNRTLGLGGYPLVSLAEAREQAFANRRLARTGGDPLAAKRSKRDVPTFEAAAAYVFDMHKPSWRNPKHAAQWWSTLERYAFPYLGKLTVSDVTTADVMTTLLPIWNEKEETARRVRQRIGAVMKWSVAQGFREENPAGDAISAALPRHYIVRSHHRALPHHEVPDVIAAVRSSDASISVKLAFEFLVLTACRSGEVRLATWEEINLDKRMWIIPGERMKAKRQHRVPLSSRSIEILNTAQDLAQDQTMPIFPGTKYNRPLSDSTLSKLCRDLNLRCVPHGFRSSFRDWASECTDAPREVTEAALAHVVRNKVEAAYARSDLFDRRRKLMEAWSAYLET